MRKNKDNQYLDLPDREPHAFLYQKYLEWLQINHPGVEHVKLSYYRYMFNTLYNIETKKPRMDECGNCKNLVRQIGDLKELGKDASALENDLKVHRMEADVAYLHLKTARDESLWDPKEWTVICIDLQKTHLLPKTTIGSHYYLRKLNVYNFGIVNVLTDKTTFYVWEEFNGKKGSAEIYSCIQKWLMSNVLNKPNYPKKLRIIADNCGGQNKNNNLALALLRLVHQNLFHRIELVYLVPGHSYMPCDRKFGNVSLNLQNIHFIASPDVLISLLAKSIKNGLKVY